MSDLPPEGDRRTPSLWELVRRDLHQVRNDMAAMEERLNRRLDSQAYVRKDVYDRDHAEMRSDVESLMKVTRWMIGLLITALVMAIAAPFVLVALTNAR